MNRTQGPGNNAGFFEDEDVQNGVPGTIVTADWLNAVQEEILEVIKAGGITPKAFDKADPDSYTQLLQALLSMFLTNENANFVRLTDAIIPLLPAGIALPYFRSAGAPPDGMVALGPVSYSLPRANYPDLVPLIGYGIGSGDGSTTLTIPALPNGFPIVNWGQGFLATLGTTTSGDVKWHGHGVSDPGHAHGSRYGPWTPSGLDQAGSWEEIGFMGDSKHFATTTSWTGISIAGTGSTHNYPAGMYARFGLTCGRVVA